MLLCGSSCVCIFAQRTAGAAGTRPSLRPPGSRGCATKQSSGEFSRENATPRLRYNMRVGRAAPPPHSLSLRAQRSNPESLRGDSLDCFAALAMTTSTEPAPYSAVLPRTQRSVPSTVRCRAGAHVAASCRVAPGARPIIRQFRWRRRWTCPPQSGSMNRLSFQATRGSRHLLLPALPGFTPPHLRETVGNALCLRVIPWATGPDPER